MTTCQELRSCPGDLYGLPLRAWLRGHVSVLFLFDLRLPNTHRLLARRVGGRGKPGKTGRTVSAGLAQTVARRRNSGSTVQHPSCPNPSVFPGIGLRLAWLNSRDRFWLFLAIEGSDLQGLTGIGDNLIINIVDPILRGKAFGSTGGN